MRDDPNSAALLTIVADTLHTEVIPHLSGPPAYQARLAASVVAIVLRGLERGAADDLLEAERLRALLSRDGSLRDLNVDLAARLRDGRLSIDDPAVAAHLWETAMAKLAVDQPGYSRYTAIANSALTY